MYKYKSNIKSSRNISNGPSTKEYAQKNLRNKKPFIFNMQDKYIYMQLNYANYVNYVPLYNNL